MTILNVIDQEFPDIAWTSRSTIDLRFSNHKSVPSWIFRDSSLAILHSQLQMVHARCSNWWLQQIAPYKLRIMSLSHVSVHVLSQRSFAQQAAATIASSCSTSISRILRNKLSDVGTFLPSYVTSLCWVDSHCTVHRGVWKECTPIKRRFSLFRCANTVYCTFVVCMVLTCCCHFVLMACYFLLNLLRSVLFLNAWILDASSKTNIPSFFAKIVQFALQIAMTNFWLVVVPFVLRWLTIFRSTLLGSGLSVWKTSFTCVLQSAT